mmetsp:Transcript_57529/g.106261  ORF Transcript_57529/g.106261 Transcript_57529/m.106261 type:complete len:252 (+) Transcript_57529:101-856(+)
MLRLLCFLLATVASVYAAQRGDSSTEPACPSPEGMVGTCVEACSDHSDCQEGQLCCSNGCGHVCMGSAEARQMSSGSQCSVIVVFPRDTANVTQSSADVLALVPSPDSTRLLTALAMVTFHYGARDTDCCAASAALASSELVRTVEYGDDIPACKAVAENPPEKPAAGGWSEATAVDADSQQVWHKVLKSTAQYNGVDLASLGQPVQVQKQVVAGMNYKFVFADGSTVQVFHQPWTKTLSVEGVELSRKSD